MTSVRVPEYRIVAGAVRAELARRRITRHHAVLALQAAGTGLGRTAAYDRIAGVVPFSWEELEVLSTSFAIPLDVLTGACAPDVAVIDA